MSYKSLTQILNDMDLSDLSGTTGGAIVKGGFVVVDDNNNQPFDADDSVTTTTTEYVSVFEDETDAESFIEEEGLEDVTIVPLVISIQLGAAANDGKAKTGAEIVAEAIDKIKG